VSVSMKDIAEIAGVDVSTVSRALAGEETISPETRTRVLQIAEEKGYKRRGARTRTVSYVIDKKFFLLTSHFYNRVIEGIEGEVTERGYTFHFQSLEPGRFALEALSMRNPSGIIVTSVYHDDMIRELKKAGIPTVLLDCYVPTEDVSAVLIDNMDGIIRGMQYLSSLGHRRIAYLAGDLQEIGSEDRLAGSRKAVRMFGLEDDPALVLESDFSISGAYQAMRRLLETRQAPTAVAAVNDMTALGAMEAIKERAMRIPQDISVLGFDDISLADEVIPRLSTLHVPKRTMGRLAVQRLFRLMEGRYDEFGKILVSPRLVVRESTAAPSGGSPPRGEEGPGNERR
jgi:LacI family transcriptional regulator